ncbi:hypothetical protein [Mycobacteroides abscessus]|uniref:hypothetical protein n=1 Tax=Mycobacteroides abscessus TaxID=36809 RepID=UPI000C25E177|nr:hypothetical protein [Mycobacteroides abscessus]
MANFEKMGNAGQCALIQDMRDAVQSHKEAHEQLIAAYNDDLSEKVRLGAIVENGPHYQRILNGIAEVQTRCNVLEDDLRDRIAKIESQFDGP